MEYKGGGYGHDTKMPCLEIKDGVDAGQWWEDFRKLLRDLAKEINTIKRNRRWNKL